MKYIYNFLWFLCAVITLSVGATLFIPALLLLFISRVVSISVVVLTFSGLMVFAKLFGTTRDTKHIHDVGVSCINKL